MGLGGGHDTTNVSCCLIQSLFTFVSMLQDLHLHFYSLRPGCLCMLYNRLKFTFHQHVIST